MSIVLVTGASRGIGADLSRRLARVGHTVYAGMRKAVDPQREGICPIELDVTEASSADAAVAQVIEESGGLDLLVNNAGVAWFVAAEEMSEEVLRTTFETNFFGAVRCTQAVLPHFRERRAGGVVMVSSLAAARGLPLESAYCASKSALEAYAESLREEVRRFGVSVSLVEPGITEGGLSTSVSDPWAKAGSAYQPLLDHTHAFYRAAQAELDSPKLIFDAVAEILGAAEPKLRYPLGALAPLIAELRRADEPAADATLRDALGIAWWGAGQEAPA